HGDLSPAVRSPARHDARLVERACMDAPESQLHDVSEVCRHAGLVVKAVPPATNSTEAVDRTRVISGCRDLDGDCAWDGRAVVRGTRPSAALGGSHSTRAVLPTLALPASSIGSIGWGLRLRPSPLTGRDGGAGTIARRGRCDALVLA